MSETSSLIIFSQASKMLSEADTIQKVKELKNLALTAADWAKRKGLGEEAIRYAKSYALEAERKLGEMLLQTERAKPPGDNQYKKQDRLSHVTEAPTLSDLGITKTESSDAQNLASVPVEEFEQVKSGKKTKKQVIRKVKQKKHAEKVKKVKTTTGNLLEKPNLILADPPWQYDFSETENRAIENQYATAQVPEIIQHKPETQDSAILFLWATAPKLVQAISVLESWGFTYVTNAIWDKEKIGMGYWFRGQHELLLVGRKGKVSPPIEELRVSSVFREPRRKHSQKPECVYEWIEKAFPSFVKLEMYSRTKREGWIQWGAEA